jgi:hypothetical protein
MQPLDSKVWWGDFVMGGEENGGEENGAGHGGGHGERGRARRMSLSWREENEAGHGGGGHGDVRIPCHVVCSSIALQCPSVS